MTNRVTAVRAELLSFEPPQTSADSEDHRFAGDDVDLAFIIERNLIVEGYVTHIAGDGEAGIEAAIRGAPSLVILDLMLPKRDGFRVLVAIRGAGIEAPVLLLTARRQERDKLEGFRLGADDYLTKPFSMAELIARLEALRRRATRWARPRGSATTGRLRVGDINSFRRATKVLSRNRCSLGFYSGRRSLSVAACRLASLRPGDVTQTPRGRKAEVGEADWARLM